MISEWLYCPILNDKAICSFARSLSATVFDRYRIDDVKYEVPFVVLR